MKRMPYLDDKDLLESLTTEYVGLMVTNHLKKKWRKAKCDYPELTALTYSINQLVSSPFGILARIAQEYHRLVDGLGEDRRNEIEDSLDRIFNYDYYRNRKIAPFFKKHSDDMGLYICYYCDMTYINIFSYTDKVDGARKVMGQFDIDHVIEKSKCPILALSLFNFVPSCQICNERIKHDKSLAEHPKLLKKYSPTSKDFDFDRKVSIELVPRGKVRRPFLKNADDYDIHFDCHKDKDYGKYVKFMLLEERYNYHKSEALRLKDLQMRYPASNIHNIASMLRVPDEEVKEDIFGLKFSEDQHRCFNKLKRDMLK